MKLLITAGGGGHFSPALAVMHKLPKGTEVLYVGRKYAFEGEKTLAFEYLTVKELGIPFKTITTGRLQRTISLKSLTSLAKLPVGLTEALQIVREFKPDVVFSTGGYIALPVTLAARMLGVPVVIHEQTMGAGLTNRISGKFAARICLSWATSEKYFPESKTVLTGNPLKESFTNSTPAKKLFHDDKPIIFITGGSLGSHAINMLIGTIIEKLLPHYCVYHQTGDAKEYTDFELLEKKRATLPDSLQSRYYLTKFVPTDDIAGVLREATMVIGRAGASTITELLFFKKPALLIPLPYGQRNEQLENAKYLASVGLARVLLQEDANDETMYTEIAEIMGNLTSYTLKEVPEVIQKNAAEKIVTTILSVAQKAEPDQTPEAKNT